MIQTLYPKLNIACSPENLRRGKAINDFMNPERIVVGCDYMSTEKIEELFAPLNKPIFWTSVETAEMIKHAINSYLAMSIAFINEIDKICTVSGANSKDVAYGLQSDKRIGFLSYLKPGGPYTNDTLGREIYTLIELDKKFNLGLSLFPAIKKSNDAHSNNG
jgi:UDPglucose 6-dehydrogenase